MALDAVGHAGNEYLRVEAGRLRRIGIRSGVATTTVERLVRRMVKAAELEPNAGYLGSHNLEIRNDIGLDRGFLGVVVALAAGRVAEVEKLLSTFDPLRQVM